MRPAAADKDNIARTDRTLERSCLAEEWKLIEVRRIDLYLLGIKEFPLLAREKGSSAYGQLIEPAKHGFPKYHDAGELELLLVQ